MTSRRDVARRRAAELVFESLQRQVPLLELLERRLAQQAAEAAETAPEGQRPIGSLILSPYAVDLIRGVANHRAEISEWLDTYSQGWPQERMPGVDRAILYVGAYEVVFEDDVPDQVILKTAADLASKLSTDKSADFVSGLLGRLSKIKATLI